VVVDNAVEAVDDAVHATTSKHITNTVAKVKTNFILFLIIFLLLPAKKLIDNYSLKVIATALAADTTMWYPVLF
jgi:hypothetical protein